MINLFLEDIKQTPQSYVYTMSRPHRQSLAKSNYIIKMVISVGERVLKGPQQRFRRNNGGKFESLLRKNNLKKAKGADV